MSKERPFEDITPIPNIKVGYFEKEEYLKIIDRQEKQIETFAYQIMALQSRIEILEKSKRLQGEWITGGKDVTGQYFYDEFICNKCYVVVDNKSNFSPRCGADMRGGKECI